MKKILLLNGGKQFAHSDGRYNQTLHDAAVAYLDRAGFDVKQTFIDGAARVPMLRRNMAAAVCSRVSST